MIRRKKNRKGLYCLFTVLYAVMTTVVIGINNEPINAQKNPNMAECLSLHQLVASTDTKKNEIGKILKSLL